MITRIERVIIPDKLIANSHLRNIKLLNDDYIIKEFEVSINDKTKYIDRIFITNGKHPNCDPFTKELCIPEYLRRDTLNNDTVETIIRMLKVFNFDSSYEKPWDSFNIIIDERR